MKQLKSLVLAGLLIAGITGVVAGCGSETSGTRTEATAAATAAQEQNVTIRFAGFPNLTHSQFLSGRAGGEFQKAVGESNKIDWKTFNAGPAEIEALFAGEVDIGYIGPGPAINGFVKSKGDLQILAGSTNAGAILIARKDAPISSARDLAGKKIAVPQFGNTQDLSLRNILRENNLKDTTKGGNVEVRQAENADIKTLIEKGDIDAALVPEPWGSRIVKESGAKVVLDYKDIWRGGDYSTAVLIGSTRFIKAHPGLVQSLVDAHVALTDKISKDNAQAQKDINAQITALTGKGIADDILSSALGRLTVTNDPSRASVEEFAKLSFEAGFVKENPDIKDLFNLTFLNKSLKAKGLPEVR